MHILFFNMSEVKDATKLVDYCYFAILEGLKKDNKLLDEQFMLS